MKTPSDPRPDWNELRARIIGLGERSIRKSHYPELEQRLVELERFRALLDQSNDLIFLVEIPSGRFADVNESACRQLDLSRDEILSMAMSDLIHPVLWERMTALFAVKSLINQDGKTIITVFKRKGGEIPVEISVRLVAFRDAAYAVIVARDLTERRQHELEREAIITVSTALRKATTRTEILTVLLDQVKALFEADGSALVMLNPIPGGATVEMGRGPVGERFSGLNIPPGKGISGWVIANKKPYLNNQADQDPLFYRPELLGDSHCVASVPLIVQEQPLGALAIARRTNISENDLRLLNAIADIAANAIHRVTLYEQAEQQLHHLIALHQIDLAISTNFDLSITLNVFLRNVRDELQVDAASILLLDPVTHTLDYAAGIGFRTRGIEQSQVRMGDEFAGRAAQEHSTVSCSDLRQASQTFGRASLLSDEEFVSHYATPLMVKGQVKGVLEIFHRETIEPDLDWISYFETLATQAAIAIESATLFEDLQQSNMELMLAYDATIEGWSRALDLRDRETEGHTQRVTQMALYLADKVGMSKAEKRALRRGALLHDIGKMGIPDSILLKPGLLSDGEWDVMRQHPTYANQMLSPISYLKQALDIPYCHHEKWDGTGYPRGLKGEEIPLAARVFAVVDVFDALTSDRPYRAAWSREAAYQYIQEQAGKHFDPQVVEIFLESRRDEEEDRE
ncbi:MAG: HD domain-containing phosphohydrolase [Chloroflexota bacterium]